MASMAMTAANGATATTNSSTSPSNSSATGSGRPQFKMTTGSRPDTGNRRQSGSPMDTTQRRSSTQKAWTATNPITQRTPNYNQQNGSASQPKGGVSKTPTANVKETNTPDKHANDRLLFLLANFLGRSATVTVKNGDKFTGVFSGSSVESTEPAYVLKMAKHIKSVTSNEQSNGVKDSSSGYIGTGAEHVMIFELRDVVDLSVDAVVFNDMTSRPQNGVASTFRIDADIGGNVAVRQRDLQPWVPGEDVDADLSLEGTAKAMSPGRGAEWDQFEANERLYGVKSDYDENLYTIAIDRTNPLYKQRLAAAEKIAREIEGASPMNSHVAEERGLIPGDDSGVDEEDKYSGVQRKNPNFPPLQSGQANKYTPPARRPPTGQPTVPGAPVDPAIISSQLARPDATASRAPQEKPTSQASRRQTPPPSQTEQPKAAPSSTVQKSTVQPTESATPSAKTTPTIKGPTESTQNQSPPTGASDYSSPKPKTTVSGTGVGNVEYEVRDAFRQFANQEKMRFQEHRRNQAKHDKNIKLNDLMKFSQNFKLNTPVPKDLIPILAKDKNKQEEIMERARKAAEEKSQNNTTNGKSAVALTEQRTQRPLAAPKYDGGGSPAHALPDRQNFTRGKNVYPQQGPYNTQSMRADRSLQGQTIPVHSGRSGPGLSQRLANIQLQNKVGTPLSSVPSPVPIQEPRLPPTGPAISTADIGSAHKSSGVPTPTSALSTKFNAKALEFKPMSFTPTGNSTSAASSPRPTNPTPPASRVSTPPNFFGARKPLPASERPSINDFFNPIKRARIEADSAKEDDKSPDRRGAHNWVIKPAYKTPPTWEVTEENKDKSYTEMFDKVTFSTPPISSPQTSHVNPQLPHQHQLPFHLQHGGQGVPPPQVPPQAQHHLHTQPHHHPVGPAPHYDDHRIHVSSPPSVLPSPHLQTANLAYPSPMARGAQLMYGQHVPQYAIGPNGPQMAQFGQYPGVPQFIPQQGSQVGAPMMAHGPSGGPFMIPHVPFGQQVQMYSPGQVHAYPQHGPPPPPGSTGFPSPGRGAPMMMHQSSQQGQPPQQMMMIGMSPGQHVQPIYAPQPAQIPIMQRGYPHPPQPQFGTSPHQSHPYQSRGGPGGNYGLPPPSGPHVATQQPPTQPQSHQPDGGEDGK